MSRQVFDLEAILQQLIAEHHKLLKLLELHAAAMKTLDVKKMEELGALQEAGRLRVMSLETRRRAIVGQLAQAHAIKTKMTIARIAELYPDRGPALIRLRNELKELASGIAGRAHVSGRLASSLLGHLNTVVRIVAGAVERAGLYTKDGTAQVSSRIGCMDAVG